MNNNELNGYKLTSDAYRQLVKKGLYPKELADKICKINDFLSECDDDDINTLFDSSAFNFITKCYIRKALDNLEIDDELKRLIRNEVRLLLDEFNASEIQDLYDY